jgi:3-isopropylmalate/(R)-2-methylmalate dehydratase small subunit
MTGSQVVVSQSYARIFFRNCISTGELYPVETDVRLCDELTTGQEVTVDMEKDVLVNHATGKEYSLKPIGEVCTGLWAGCCGGLLLLKGFCWRPPPGSAHCCCC